MVRSNTYFLLHLSLSLSLIPIRCSYSYCATRYFRLPYTHSSSGLDRLFYRRFCPPRVDQFTWQCRSRVLGSRQQQFCISPQCGGTKLSLANSLGIRHQSSCTTAIWVLDLVINLAAHAAPKLSFDRMRANNSNSRTIPALVINRHSASAVYSHWLSFAINVTAIISITIIDLTIVTAL